MDHRYVDERERAWASHTADTERATTKVTTPVVLVIYSCWAGIDYLLEPSRIAELLPARFGVVGLVAILGVVQWRATTIAVVRAAVAAEVIAAGVLVAYFTVVVDHTVFYTVAFSLVFWGFGLLLRWNWPRSAGCFAVIHVAHLALWLALDRRDPATFFAFYVYLVTTSAACVVVGAVRRRLQRMAFVAAFELERKHEELGALIGNTTSAIWSADRQLQLIASNEVFATRFGGDHRATRWRAHYDRALGGEQFGIEITEDIAGALVPFDVSFNPILHGSEVTGVAVFAQDIAARKTQEQRLARVQRELLNVSRLAGMADIASAVLHDVGNALNSARVSARMATDHLHQLKLDRLETTGELLLTMTTEATPTKVGQIGTYLKQLGANLSTRRASVMTELGACLESVDKIAGAVAAQTVHAGVIRVEEDVDVAELLTTAIELCQPQLGRTRVEIVSVIELAVRVERFKILQILSNLILHAAQAIETTRVEGGTVRVSAARSSERLTIEVCDNGGIENRSDPAVVFRQEFGRGPDLHWSLLAARQIGGDLSSRTDAQTRSTTLSLELPLVAAVRCSNRTGDGVNFDNLAGPRSARAR